MKILCLDGGGVFGILQARILAECDLEKFDVIVGTSIGSAIGASIALGHDPKELPEFFHEWMPKIFKKSIRSWSPLNSKYSDKGLNSALRNLFGSSRMGDAKVPLFITCSDVSRVGLRVFDSTYWGDARTPMWEVVRCATAAQTFFPPWNGLADGGVFANNPSMVGVAAVSRTMGVPVEDLDILSIGTGEVYKTNMKTGKNVVFWGKWLINALLNGASDQMHDYFVRSLPVSRYTRIQPPQPEGLSFDSYKDMLKAEIFWEDAIASSIHKVRSF